jgi:hypothetical protein
MLAEENIVMGKKIDPEILTDLQVLKPPKSGEWFLECRLYVRMYVCMGEHR